MGHLLGRHRRRFGGHRPRWVSLVVAMSLLVIVAVPAGGQTPTETVAATTAEVLPDETLGWVPVDFVKHPLNPVHEFAHGEVTDMGFPVVMRVDDKLAAPLDGHRWYLWNWRHGLYPRTPSNGGRMHLATADRLEGPWTDRGYVTPVDNGLGDTGWNPYSLTGGDVVWSDEHQKFFTVPHTGRCWSGLAAAGYCTVTIPEQGLDSFLWESADGVNWSLSQVPQPVLPAGPEWFDRIQTGYGQLLRQPGCPERWIWLYRSHRRIGAVDYATLSVAYADDIYGPWVKSAANPVFDPYAGQPVGGNGGHLIGIDGLLHYGNTYQMLWQDSFGEVFLARSWDLVNWTPFLPYGAGDTALLGREQSAPVFIGGQPHEAVITGGTLVYDDTVGAFTFLYTGWDAGQLVDGVPGSVSVNIARSLTGGTPPNEPSGACP